MKILYGLKLVLLFFLVFLFTQTNLRDVDKDDNVVSESSVDSMIALDDFNISLNELISITKWNRNPFLPYYSLSTEEILDADQMHSLVLNKIYREKGEMRAIINNRMIGEGDFYLDKRVKYIGESIVVLENDDHPFIGLTLESTKN